MNIPEIFATLSSIPFLNGVYLVIPFLIFGIMLAVSNNRVVSFVGLSALYFSAGLLIVGKILPHLALLIWIVGFFTVIILMMIQRPESKGTARPPELLPIISQLLIVLVVVLIGWVLEFFGLLNFTGFNGDPALQPYTGFVIFLLLCTGLIRFFSSDRAFFGGVGLLIIFLALLLFLLAWSPGRSVLFVWAFASLVMAVVTSYLTQREIAESGRLLPI